MQKERAYASSDQPVNGKIGWLTICAFHKKSNDIRRNSRQSNYKFAFQ